MLPRLEMSLDGPLVAARGGSRDRVSRREVTEIVDRTGEQRRHALARGVTVETSLDRQRDRFSQQRYRVIRGEDRCGMVKGEVDTAQVEWMAVYIARQLHQLVAQQCVGIDTEVGAGDILDGLRSSAERLERVEDARSEAPLLRERPQGAPILGPA